MPNNRYLEVRIDRQKCKLYSAEDFPFSISYALEDAEDFQTKVSSTAISWKFPACPVNDAIFNVFYDPSMEDTSPGQAFRSLRQAHIVCNSFELLAGKCILVSATHDSCPIEYEADFYGNNGDWIISLKDNTLYDFLKQLNFVFTGALIQESWDFDGTDETLPYVFAPIRYGQSMDGIYLPNPTNQNPPPVQLDYNMTAEYMRPSLSAYWIIYWAFKSLGYRIESDFFATDYFRRQVMPWTWGNFLDSGGTQLDVLKFLAKSDSSDGYWFKTDYNDYVDLKVTNDNVSPAFDNSNTYHYDAGLKQMIWTYPGGFGSLDVTFKLSLSINMTLRGASECTMYVEWLKNGVVDLSKTAFLIMVDRGASIGRTDYVDLVDLYQTFTVDTAGDTVSCRVYVEINNGVLGSGNIVLFVEGFDFEYAHIPLGGTIDFTNFIGFQKWAFLDFFAGIIDFFNLSVQADPLNKVVRIEPQHDYSLTNDFSVRSGGYINGHTIDWDKKQDLKKTSTLNLFSDYSQQLVFRFKDDSQDGILKVIQDRYTVVLATGTYVLPDRFKTETKNIENRFFSPVMHYLVTQWQGLQDSADDPVPQMIVMAPENISNTSHEEAQNTFQPKLAWYKGKQLGTGWRWVYNGVPNTDGFPYLFAVNYRAGGEADPVLSYSDENIAGVVAKGLMKRFYWQRLAIMRNGQYYGTWIKLSNNDITNWFHREYVTLKGQRWIVAAIDDYLPLQDGSTSVTLRKFSPIAPVDNANAYPSSGNVLSGVISNSTYETKYYPLVGLASDIPQSDASISSTVVLPPLQITFDSTGVATILYDLIFAVGKTIYIDFGDGTGPQRFSGSTVAGGYEYATSGDYTVNIYFDGPGDLTSAFFPNDNIVGISSFVGFDSLTGLGLIDNMLTTFDATALPDSLLQLSLDNNLLTSFDASSLPPGLSDLEITGNQITGFDPSELPASVLFLFINNNKIPASDVNATIERLVAIATLPEGVFTSSGQTPAAPLDSGGLAAKTTLDGLGWSISTD